MKKCGCAKRSFWRDIVFAVNNKDADPALYARYFIGAMTEPAAGSLPDGEKKPLDALNKTLYYPLDGSLVNVAFTTREAQVMLLIMQGYTNRKVGAILGLSPRTTEFYIRNMRKKTGSYSKLNLIDTIKNTQFLDRLDFTLSDLMKAGEKDE